MKVTTKGRYGLLAMVDLAAQEDGKCVSLKSVAERVGISEHYLEQLIKGLKKAGFVKSMRGAQGGYRLERPPADISVGDVLRVLEGSLSPAECLSEGANAACGGADCDNCVTKPVWGRIYESVNGVVDSISLSELARDYKVVKGSAL
jgi:Rrf2 family protein